MKKTSSKILLLAIRFGPSVFMSALIFYLSSLSGLKVSSEWKKDYVCRKIFHVIFYFALTISYMWAQLRLENIPTKFEQIISRFKVLGRKSYKYILFIVFLFAVSDEFHQYFVSQRTGKFIDVFIDMIGALFAVIFLRKVSRI